MYPIESSVEPSRPPEPSRPRGVAKLEPAKKIVKIMNFMFLLFALVELSVSNETDNLILLPLLRTSIIQIFSMNTSTDLQ